jgi:signal transduction histidine kinase
MKPDRIWLGYLNPRNRSLIYEALQPFCGSIREAPFPEAAASLTPEGALGILIQEGPIDPETPRTFPLPTLWLLPPGAPLPPMDGPEPDEFVRMPATPEEIRNRTQSLLRAIEHERSLRRLEEAVSTHPERLRGVVTAIGHDLASPVTAVLEYLDLLIDGSAGKPTPEQRALLGAAQQTARGLAERIEEIVDASRAEVGLGVDVHLASTELEPLTSDLREWAADRLAEKDQQLVIQLDPGTPNVCGDADRLKQVLRHLVKNAHHFSPPGERIEVRIGPDPEVVGFVQISVCDTGGGLGPEEFACTYDPFGAAASEKLRRPHLGIGLALVRAIIDALGGETDVSIDPGRGSVITVRVPIWESRAARITEAQADLAAPRDLPETAWLCRHCGEGEIAGMGDIPIWRTLSPGEILTISKNPPDGGTRLGRVGEFRQMGSLLQALQPCLRLQEAT